MDRTSKQQMNTVKLRVRKNALALRTFTIEEMVNVTGLNPESVRTEVQRMRRDGFVVSESLDGKHEHRPGSPKLYKLTSDAKKRLELSKQIDAFYPEPIAETAPTSFHYRKAVALLDEVTRSPNLARDEQVKLLTMSREELEFAREDEGETTETVEAFIESQVARLLYLEGEVDDAAEVFEKAKVKFQAAGLHDEASKADQWLLLIMINRLWKGLGPVTIETRTHTALDTIRAHHASWADQPLVSLLVNLSTKLLNKIRIESSFSSRRAAIEGQIDPADRTFVKFSEEGVVSVQGAQAHARVSFKVKDLEGTLIQFGEGQGFRTIENLLTQKGRNRSARS